MTIDLEYTPEIIEGLNDERFHDAVRLVQRRMEVLWLKSHGLPHAQIAQLGSISETTMREYIQVYLDGGVEGLKRVQWYRPESDLVQHVNSLEEYFRVNPPASIKQAQSAIEALTGIKRSETQGREFLKKRPLRCRKIGMIPAKAEPDVQAAYLKTAMEPRLTQAQAGQRAVFVVEAAHFVLAPFLGFLWSAVRRFIQAPSARQRFTVLGALNAITHQLITVTNDSSITSEQVCQLLPKLAELHLTVPITLFLDHAADQRGARVLHTAAELPMELCFLPPYSPTLKLIERLWKLVRKACLYSPAYDKFPAFKTAIAHCLAQTHTQHKSPLDSLLSLHFQMFQKALFLPA